MENNFNIKEIVRVELKGVNTYLFFASGYSESVGNSIDELEKEFSAWSFVRIHPRHLINPAFYKKVSKVSTPAIEMNDGSILPADKNLIKISEFGKKQYTWWSKLLQIMKINN